MSFVGLRCSAARAAVYEREMAVPSDVGYRILLLTIGKMSASFVDSSLLGVAISLPIVATASVVVRVFANRRRGSRGVAGDDWAVFVTLVGCPLHSVE
jgi:hypothetical protein